MVIVLLPTVLELDAPGDAQVQRYGDTTELVTRLGTLAAGTRAVLYHESLAAEEQGRVAATIRHHELDVIEVRGSGWDGFSPSPLSGACRGVISGFGPAGISHAVSAHASI